MHRSDSASPAHRAGFVKVRAVRFRKSACALVVPALLVSAAACASQGGNGNGGEQSVTIAASVAAVSSGPIFLADALGYFKQQGLDVNVKTSSISILDNIAAGQIQYGSSEVPLLIPAVSKGIGLQAISVTQTTPSYILAVSQKTLNAKGITPSMSLKQTLTRLKGEEVTEVGGPLNAGAILLAFLLERNGLPGDWIKIISQTSATSAMAAFENGEVGVVFQPQPTPDQLLSKAPGRIILNTGNSPQFSSLAHVPWSIIVASKSYTAAHPDVTKKISAAIGKADDYIASNPAQAAKVLQPEMPAFSVKSLQDGLATLRLVTGGKMSDATFQAGVKVLAGYGIFNEPSADVLGAAYTSAYQS
jgi:NitT/TauT family transport system substrate-binding protein